MSNFTAASTLFALVVMTGAVALAVIVSGAARRLGEPRLRFIAAGFAILAASQAFSIYTIQVPVFHHEVTTMVTAAFDVAMVAAMAAPVFLRDTP